VVVVDHGTSRGSQGDDEMSVGLLADGEDEKLLDAIEDEVKAGGCIIDWHACDLFPKSWIDLVVVFRADTEVLYDRLTQR